MDTPDLITQFESLHTEAFKDHPNTGAQWEARNKLREWLFKNSGVILQSLREKKDLKDRLERILGWPPDFLDLP